MKDLEFKVINDNGNLVLTSTLLTADEVCEIIGKGHIDGVPADWNPSIDVIDSILERMSEDLESSATITDALVNDTADSASFVIKQTYGDEQGEEA